ncbi:TIGR02679 family protein [Bacillus sp. FJAT-27445]|uniref:TIGR02679 family protein n=1 Tax=Bacillus sp. FJAT-27445 TaxID=1679166 RepID=UPI0007442E40|nr:TIGR02679 family protein [Bacillus sp. FJAT-27445]
MDKRLELLKKEPGFQKLLIRFREKYRSVGRVGGTVKLDGFSEMELHSIAGFLAKPPHLLKEKGTLALREFELGLERTNFTGLGLKELLELYFGEPLVSKAEERQAAAEEETLFFESLITEFPHLEKWFGRMLGKKPDARFVFPLYREDRDELQRLLRMAASAWHLLPGEGLYERLPLFAQKVTGNPHAFDRNQPGGRLLLHLLSVMREGQPGGELEGKQQTEQVNELLLQYGLLRDDLWSFVTCRGFTAIGSDGGIHPVWQAAAEYGSVMNVPVRELAVLKGIEPFQGTDVWVLENSSVCSAVMDEISVAPVVCTHGQFRIASWIFFDRIVEAGCTIHYAGDLDPEGLHMAQRLKQRYPGNVLIWRMDPESYRIAISEESIGLRVSQLGAITDPILKETAEVMAKEGKASYQEGLIDLLVGDIKSRL